MSSPVQLNGAAQQLWTDARTLRSHGVNVNVADNAISMAVATASLPKRSISATFKDLVVADGKHPEYVSGLETCSLNQAQISKIAGVVRGSDAELTEPEKGANGAIGMLIANGAVFKLTTYEVKPGFLGETKRVPVTFSVRSDKDRARAFILLNAMGTGNPNYKLSYVLSGTNFPVRSIEHLAATPNPQKLQEYADAICALAKRLRGHGIEVKLPEGADAILDVTRRLHADPDQTVETRFSNLAVSTTLDQQPESVSDNDARTMQTYPLNLEDLARTDAILSGNAEGLSPASGSDLNAIERLQINGAAFDITRTRHVSPGGLRKLLGNEGKTYDDCLSIPNDRSGAALVLTHLATAEPPAAGPNARVLKITMDGTPHRIKSLDELRAMSRANCNAVTLQDRVKLMRTFGIEMDVAENRIAASITAKQLQAGNKLEVRFAAFPVERTSRSDNGVPYKISPEQTRAMQKFDVDAVKLGKLSAILSGSEEGLTDEEKSGLEAIDTLAHNGAHFKISSMCWAHERIRGSVLVEDTMAVPDGKPGRALAYLTLGEADPNGSGWNRRSLSFSANGEKHSVKSLRELADIAQYLPQKPAPEITAVVDVS